MNKLLRYFIFISPILSPFDHWGQSRLTISGGIYLNIDNGAKLVVENPASDAIQVLGTGGIITENENDQIVWHTGTSTGLYTIPFFTSPPFNSIPLSVTIGTAGTGTGRIAFSTYGGATWDNYTYRPTDVTQMSDLATGSLNNSAFVIDRFWIIDPVGYTVKPSVVLNFTYLDAEYLQPGNTITESDLGAQRFNASANLWGDYLPEGIINTVNNTVQGVSVSPSNFYRSWTLGQGAHPLAEESVYFTATCEKEELRFGWKINPESVVDHFEIEKVDDLGNTCTVAVTSFSDSAEQYQFTTSIYRSGVFQLTEVTTDGNRSVLATTSVICKENEEPAVYFDSEAGSLNLWFSGEENGIETMTLLDESGKTVLTIEIAIHFGENSLVIPVSTLAPGVYYLKFQNGNSPISKKWIKA